MAVVEAAEDAARATVSAGWAYATGSPMSELVSQRPLARNTSEEQCLNLNVFTPGLDNAKRPVMVWIHGGAFTFGTADTASDRDRFGPCG
mgnify:CR=1 FL=1